MVIGAIWGWGQGGRSCAVLIWGRAGTQSGSRLPEVPGGDTDISSPFVFSLNTIQEPHQESLRESYQGRHREASGVAKQSLGYMTQYLYTHLLK